MWRNSHGFQEVFLGEQSTSNDRPETGPGGWALILFCVAQGAGIAIVLLASLLTLRAMSLYNGEVEISSRLGKVLRFGGIR
jgi:hypothetical protein